MRLFCIKAVVVIVATTAVQGAMASCVGECVEDLHTKEYDKCYQEFKDEPFKLMQCRDEVLKQCEWYCKQGGGRSRK